MTRLLTMSALLVVALVTPAGAVRLKELGHFDGVRKNQLIGYGLVVGLDGTGDSERASFSPQSLEAMLSRLGVRVDKSQLVLRNIAAVTVTADLPAFARPGTTIDIQVSSIGDARSLVNGTLLMTPLKGANGETYAVAQGPLLVGSETERGDYGRWSRGRLNVGRVNGGALVERDVPVTLGADGVLTFMLESPDFKTAANLAEAVNRALPRLVPNAARPPAPAAPPGGVVGNVIAPPPDDGGFARPIDGGTVEIAMPAGWTERAASLIALLEGIEVEPDAVARVVVSGSTGAVVLGGEVRLSRVAIAYEGVSIDVYGAPPEAPAPGDSLKLLEESATLAEVVRSLNKLGVGARAMVDILQALATAGALHAELEVVP